MLFGGQAAYDELVESHRRWLKTFVERWQGTELQIEPGYLDGVGIMPKPPKLEDMAVRVEEMLRTRDTGPIAYGSISSYDAFYRLESTFSAHAGVALFERYLTVTDDGSREEVLEVPHSETLQRRAAAIAASYIGHLAWHVYAAFGIATTALDAILGALIQQGGMYEPPDPADI